MRVPLPLQTAQHLVVDRALCDQVPIRTGVPLPGPVDAIPALLVLLVAVPMPEIHSMICRGERDPMSRRRRVTDKAAQLAGLELMHGI